jgi:TetR/AcrR family transcriptional repressor of nem operon
MPRTKQFDEQAVVSKAVAVFTAKGYHGTSAQDLVDALGLSRSSLYDTFGDKHGLFLRVLQQYTAQHSGAVIELFANSTDLQATLRQLFDQVMRESVANGTQGGCLMVNSATDVDALSSAAILLVQENTQLVEDAFEEAIRQTQQAGTVGTQHSARALARFLHTTIAGLRVMAKAGASKEAFEDVVRLAMTLF